MILFAKHRQLNGHEFEQTPRTRQDIAGKSLRTQRVGHNWATEHHQICKSEIETDVENKGGVTKGESGEWNELGDLGLACVHYW